MLCLVEHYWKMRFRGERKRQMNSRNHPVYFDSIVGAISMYFLLIAHLFAKINLIKPWLERTLLLTLKDPICTTPIH